MLGGEQPLQAPPSVQPLTFWTYKDTQRCFSDHGHNISVEGLPCVLLHFRKGRRRQRRAHRSLFELRAKVIKVFSSSCSHHASIPLNLLQGIYLKGKKKQQEALEGQPRTKKKRSLALSLHILQDACRWTNQYRKCLPDRREIFQWTVSRVVKTDDTNKQKKVVAKGQKHTATGIEKKPINLCKNLGFSFKSTRYT